MVFEIEHERHGRIEVTEHVYKLIEKDKIEWVPQRTEPWFKKRRNHITASIVAAICNENPYESRLSALKKKVGHEKPFTGSIATEHGNKYEDEAIQKYEALTGEKVIEFGLLQSLNKDEDYLAGSPDGITATGKLIEVKCPFRRKPLEGQIPSYYVHQVQMLMHILDLPTCDFIQYVPETTWRPEVLQITAVDRCDIFWARVEPVLLRFWAEVDTYRKTGILPREISEAEEKKALKKRPRIITITGEKKKAKVECYIPIQEEIKVGANPEAIRSFVDAVSRRLSDSAPLHEENACFEKAGKCLIPKPN